MGNHNTLLSAIALALLPFVQSVRSNGTLTLYSQRYHSGVTWTDGLVGSQWCNNLDCFNDRVWSVKWYGMPTDGSFDGKARIAFYTDSDCKGVVKDWPTDAQATEEFPNNFFFDFGFENRVSSVMLWVESREVERKIHGMCPRDVYTGLDKQP